MQRNMGLSSPVSPASVPVLQACGSMACAWLTRRFSERSRAPRIGRLSATHVQANDRSSAADLGRAVRHVFAGGCG
jgi:hypothetical protein